MRKPTNLDKMYPDPTGAFSALRELELINALRLLARLTAVVLAMGTAVYFWDYIELVLP